MPIHNFTPLAGDIHTFSISSKALANNLLGDPATRQVAVYLPEGHDRGGTYPLMVDLVGFTGSGFSHLGFKAYAETVPQRVERLIGEGRMGPVVLAFPDCFTSLGGNQYINSLAMGFWADFLIEEMIPAIESRFPVKRGRQNRAVFGKSSGGYGALIHGMKYAHAWNAIACHSGDIGFDLICLEMFPKLLNRLAEKGGITGFLKALAEADKVVDGDLMHVMVLALAASYDPDPNAPKGIRLPVDPETCRLDPERWQAWLAHDPLILLDDETCRANLKRLAGIYIDCGNRDQFHLHFGSRQFRDKLERAGIAHRYEEFPDDHSNIDYRMDISLPFLYEVLTQPA